MCMCDVERVAVAASKLMLEKDKTLRRVDLPITATTIDTKNPTAVI